jgi:hypothetical protein
LRVSISPKSCDHSTSPCIVSAYSPREPKQAISRSPSVEGEADAKVFVGWRPSTGCSTRRTLRQRIVPDSRSTATMAKS